MRDIFFTFVTLFAFGAGLFAPICFTLTYLWFDLLTPQFMTFGFLQTVPISMIAGVAAVLGYLLFDRHKRAVALPAAWYMLLLLLIWTNITTFAFAVAPDAAWPKWDWASKTMLFALFMPFVIRTRAHIEAFIAVFVLCIMTISVSACAKTILSGGGYGVLNIWGGTANRLSESSTFSAFAIGVIPLAMVFLKTWPGLSAARPLATIISKMVPFIATIGMVGTGARTGLVCLAAYVILTLSWTRHRIVAAIVMSISLLLALQFVPQTWMDRMATINSPTSEMSAAGRIAVWQWTLEFVAANPFGGGYNSFVVNKVSEDGSSKAFHSVYFEMLGEHGWPGLILFLVMVISALRALRKIEKRNRDKPETVWLADYARASLHYLIIILVGGIFIGIAFQPALHFSISLAVVLYAADQYRQAATGDRRQAHDRSGYNFRFAR
ncbi:MAG: putative O-glycosylation ligase, exosortase A system-associated [Alphaproteobacteria bacterium]|nr:putative O-glycosylation ligase, exosortase A system-associated [Alphaproteobacteria bacterium]